jgi:deoxyadenosine/deoxycytidine kinase
MTTTPPTLKHLAIAGHIGVGKSSLTQLLSDELGVEPFHEPNVDNPFLKRFYSDMSAWAFHSQVFFLVHKFNAHQAHLEGGQAFIQDRTIYEDAEIFAEHLKRSGHMLDDEYKTYRDLYSEFARILPSPSLMIYLRAKVDTLFQRIELRGRPEEQSIPREYMERLQELYEAWFERYERSPKLVIEVDELDFVNSDEDRALVLKRVREALAQRGLSS